jgi:hypothetical protein
MRIAPNIRLKNTFVKHYWNATRNILAITHKIIIDQADSKDPERLREFANSILHDNDSLKLMNGNLVGLWERVGGKYAADTVSTLIRKNESTAVEYKDEPKPSGVAITAGTIAINMTPEQRLIAWQKRMRAYASERSLQKTKAIMDTEQQAINSIIDKVVNKVNAEGLSVPNARKLMKEELMNDLVIIENYQAERIARTEVNSASNFGSFEAAKEYGEGVQKTWVLSNLTVKHRESHIQYDQMEPQDMDYEYAPGLKFPGDPDCQDGGEVINCLCFYTLDTVQ